MKPGDPPRVSGSVRTVPSAGRTGPGGGWAPEQDSVRLRARVKCRSAPRGMTRNCFGSAIHSETRRKFLVLAQHERPALSVAQGERRCQAG